MRKGEERAGKSKESGKMMKSRKRRKMQGETEARKRVKKEIVYLRKSRKMAA